MNVFVIGTGSIGRRHAANAKQLGVSRVTVWDEDPDRLSQVAQELGVEAATSFQAGLEAKPDVVMVCVPTFLHVAVTLEALKTGAAIFLEKPVAGDVASAQQLVQAGHDAFVWVACNMRFHPGVAAVKQALDEQAITPLSFRSWFSHYLPNWRPGQNYQDTYSASGAQGGGILMESVHELDYLRWMGGEILQAHGHLAHVSDLEIESEDVAWVDLNLASGAQAHLAVDYLSPLKLRGCEVTGTDGVLRWTSEGKAPETIDVSLFKEGAWQTLTKVDAYAPNHMYLEQFKAFLDAVETKAAPEQSLEEATNVLSWCSRIKDTATVVKKEKVHA